MRKTIILLYFKEFDDSLQKIKFYWRNVQQTFEKKFESFESILMSFLRILKINLINLGREITDFYFENFYIFFLCILMIPLILFILTFFKSIFFPKQKTKNYLFMIIFLNICLWLYSIYIYINFAFYDLILNIKCGVWFDFSFIIVHWGFLFDPLSLSMIVVVLSISTLVQLFSLDYMKNDPYRTRFFSYLNLFTFFMLFLVTADNFLQLFLGWEGVGLRSYLLIGFWTTRLQAIKSALKAMIVNRIGDFALLFAIGLIFYIFRTLDFLPLYILINYLHLAHTQFLSSMLNIDLICLFLFIGAVGKSAQIGLHTWLPDAMEGPTPVSALIHAATMVTAGVFLLIRCSFFFEYSEKILLLIIIIGGLTAFFSATIGLVQHDIKKIIAFSTCSQLGFMIIACGLSAYNVALFHLTTHAFFKALLFLTAGSIIHLLNDEQDIRKMGGLYHIMPISYIGILIGSTALIGFPFLSGYYSKDLILELLFIKAPFNSYILYIILVLCAFFTTLYSCRLLFWVFFSKTNISRGLFKYILENSWMINIVIIILSLASIFIGYFCYDFYVGVGSLFFANVIFIHPQNYLQNYIEFLPIFIKLIPFLFGCFGIIICFFVYSFSLIFVYKIKIVFFTLYIFLTKKWYFDILYNYFISFSFFKQGYMLSYFILDKGLLELFGPSGIFYFIWNMLKLIKNQQKTKLQIQYLCSGVCVLFNVFIFCFIYF